MNLEVRGVLKNKVMLITGASRGIGRATALLAAENHARVIVNYRAGEREAGELVKAITDRGLDAAMVRADVSREAEVAEMFSFVRDQYGRLDVLVNNAGIMVNGLIMMTSAADYARVMDINCRGPFLCSRQAAKMMMKAKGGRIINLCSIVGVQGNEGQSVYAGSKAFLIGFTRSLAKELGRYDICVNAVAPGFIDTDMTRGLKPEIRDRLNARIPLGRMGPPGDVARVILFLSSDLAGYVSGQIIGVDGSQVM
jgi:3-oxoacyl-[acyl-carrier protein] reductase